MGFKISLPRLAIPAIKIPKGIISFWVGPWKVTIPPGDIQIFAGKELLPATTVFDSEWILNVLDEKAGWIGSIARGVVDAAIPGIIQAVFNAVEPYLDGLAADFYKRHSEE